MTRPHMACLSLVVLLLASGCRGDSGADAVSLTSAPPSPGTQTTVQHSPTTPTDTPTQSVSNSTSSPITRPEAPPPATTQPEGASSTQPETTTTTLAPLRALRYQPVFSDVRGILDDKNAMPLQIVERPGDQYNYLITREGRVWVVEEDTLSNPPVLDLRESILIGSETGLLGISLHPSDPQRMYLYYTDLESDIIIAEYRLDDTLRTVIPSSARTLMKIPTRSDFHKGGMIAFGPDGYLYVGVGDDGYSYQGQDPTSFFGSILRLDVDGGDPYGIPTDHPPLTPDAPEVYIYGLRNPWRFWIDPMTNVIYIGDVGSDSFEEIDVASLDAPGANFGWSILEDHQWGPFGEGIRCQENPGTCDTSGFFRGLYT